MFAHAGSENHRCLYCETQDSIVFEKVWLWAAAYWFERVIRKNMILLCHANNKKWDGTIPPTPLTHPPPRFSPKPGRNGQKPNRVGPGPCPPPPWFPPTKISINFVKDTLLRIHIRIFVRFCCCLNWAPLGIAELSCAGDRRQPKGEAVWQTGSVKSKLARLNVSSAQRRTSPHKLKRLWTKCRCRLDHWHMRPAFIYWVITLWGVA